MFWKKAAKEEPAEGIELKIPEDMRDKHSQKKDWDDSIRTILLAILIALLFRSFLLEPFHIPSGSMKPNLLVGDYLFVTKFSYGYSRFSFPYGLPLFEGRVMELGKPERGDVVVFRPPKNTRIDFIKRVVGLPGDKIQVRGGILYINDQIVPRDKKGTFTDDEDPNHVHSVDQYVETLPNGEEFIVLDMIPDYAADYTGVYEVPPGHYFMMGDNRDNSRDSRFLDEVGFVPEENIVGRADIIFFSSDGSAKWWEFWKWPTALRWNRFLKTI